MNPVSWFEIYVQDMQRATKFYETVLNIQLISMNSPLPHLQMMAFPYAHNTYGATGTLVKMEDNTPLGNRTMIYFECEDCFIEESRVVAAGGQIKKSKFSIAPYGSISHIYDSEGNLIGLHSK